jgi:YidC/Oxa1 family membrane protein insertase
MNDIRRTILWVIFGFSMVLLWDQWQIHNGQKATFFPAPAQQKAVTPSASANVASSAGVPAPVAMAANANSSVPVNDARVETAKEKIDVTTDVFKLTFETEGGTLSRVELLKHIDVHHPGQNEVLLDDSKERVYLAQTGLISGAAGASLPTHKTLMAVRPGARTLKADDKELAIVFESPVQNGVKLIKTYTVKPGAYDIAVKHEIVNTSNQEVAPQLYYQLVRDGNKPEGESSFYSTFTGPAVYTGEKKYEKVEFKDIEKDKAEFQKKTSDGYVAMVQHYFVSAWLLPDGTARDNFMRKIDTNLFSVGMITPLESIAAGTTKVVESRFFAGPQEEKKLEALYPGLDLVKDYGWLTIMAKPLYWLVDKLNGILHNWGWSIVALVVLLKAGFYWLNAHAYQSMAKMKAVNPRIMEMRERLKDNPQQMQMEMMKIYREEKVNPMGG